MRLKINQFEAIITFLLLLEVNFFCIIPFPNFFYIINSHFHKVVTLFIALVLFIKTPIKYIKKRKTLFHDFVFIFLAAWFFILVYSVINYTNTNLFGAFLDYYYFLIILLYYYIFQKCIDNDSNFKFIQRIIKQVAVMFSIILLFQYFMLNKGVHFLAFNDSFLSVNTENRMLGGFEIVLYSGVFFCSDLFDFDSRSVRIKALVAIFIELLYLAIVAKSRSSVIIYVVMIFFSLSMNLRNRTTRKILTFLFISIFLIAILLTYSNIIDYFQLSRGSSYRQRIREVVFYFDNIFANGVIGIGFLRDSTENAMALHGFENLYYTSDIGLLGFIAIWGLIGILLLIYFAIKCIKVLRAVSNKIGKYHNLVICTLLYIICTSINLSMFDVQRIIYFPIMLAIMDCCYFRINNKEYRGVIKGDGCSNSNCNLQ
nr:hypothetical protein [uncultured Acetatifactor sp.]